MEQQMTMAARVLQYRAEYGLTQDAFAKRAGVSKSLIAHLESNPDRVLRRMTSVKIERALAGQTCRQCGE